MKFNSRFDGYEVLGDRITISWYKDVRKARAYGMTDYQGYQRGPANQRWQQDRYDYRQGYGGGRGRGGPGGYRGGQRGSWHPRGSDYSDRSRRYTRSSSRSHSRSASGRSRGSRSVSRSTSPDGSRSRSDSRDRSRKRRRSGSDTSPRRRTSRKGKGRAGSSSSQSRDRDSRSESGSLPPPSEPVSKKKGKRRPAKKSSTSRTPSASRDSKAKDMESHADGDVETSDVADYTADDGTSPLPVPPPAGGAKASRAGMRSAVASVGGGKKGKMAAADDDVIEVQGGPDGGRKVDNPGGAAAAGGKVKKLKGRVMEDPISDEDDMFAEKSVPRRLTKEHEDFLLEQNKKSSGKDTVAGGQSDSDMAVSPADQLFDDNGVPVKRRPNAAGKKQNASKEFDAFEDDGEGATAKRRRHDGGGRTSRTTAAAANKRAPTATGAVGLSFEKMQLVRQKKEEIEKAYRQDCETFATVTKMLISKEPSLEDKIQNSLRENLKDIGHRCIQEMRDFIDRLKEEDIDDV